MTDTVEKSIEHATRKVFQLFLKSKIQRKKKISLSPKDYIGVDVSLTENDTRMALFMGKDTLNMVKRTLAESQKIEKNQEYEIIGEMVQLIAGNARSPQGTSFTCTVPKMQRPAHFIGRHRHEF